MEVQVLTSTVVHASRPPAAEFDVPLTVFDKFACNFHIAILYAFLPQTASNEAIKDGLAETLLHFPTLTGRLVLDDPRRPCIHVGGRDGGVLLVETAVASKMTDDGVLLEPSPEMQRLHPPTDGAKHLLQVQLNRFSCGGLVVGATSHHRVADGESISNFIIAWGRSARGLAVDPLPVHDYGRWLQPRRPPRCEFEHWGTEFAYPAGHSIDNDLSPPPPTAADGQKTILNILLHYSGDFIAKALKAQTRERYSTFETLLGHLWRKITMARGLAGDQTTQINVAVNGRRRLEPPVPAEFFGNLILDAHPRASAAELLGGGLDGAAGRIRDAIGRMADGRRFRSFVDFGAMHEGEDLKPVYEVAGMVLSLYPNLEANSWLGFRLGDAAFGEGRLCGCSPSWIPVDGILVFLPSLRGDGGVDVSVALFEEHATMLRQISHSTD